MDARRIIPSSVRLESRPCPLGCPPSDSPLTGGVDRIHGLPGAYSIVRCAGCGLARTDPRPTADSIGFYYPDDYGPYQYTRAVSSEPTRVPAWKKLARKLVDFNAYRLPAVEPGYALELGCASGAHLAHLASMGHQVEGVEPNARAAEHARARGFLVQHATVEQMRPPAAPPSLIVGFMVLEHLHEPVACLEQLHGWSAPGARLVVSVPDRGALFAKLSGTYWHALHLPCHLYHFDAESVTALLARGGFRVDAIHRHRVVGDYLTTAANGLEDAGIRRAPAALRAIATRRALHLGAYPLALAAAALGQTGRMTVWATRA